MESLETKNCLIEIKKAFAVQRCRDDKKILYTSYMLQGDAFNWYRTLEQKYEQDREQLTWKRFRREFYDKYFSRSIKTQKEQDFIHLKQRNMTAMEYEAKFMELAKIVPRLVENECD